MKARFISICVYSMQFNIYMINSASNKQERERKKCVQITTNPIMKSIVYSIHSAHFFNL